MRARGTHLDCAVVGGTVAGWLALLEAAAPPVAGVPWLARSVGEALLFTTVAGVGVGMACALSSRLARKILGRATDERFALVLAALAPPLARLVASAKPGSGTELVLVVLLVAALLAFARFGWRRRRGTSGPGDTAAALRLGVWTTGAVWIVHVLALDPEAALGFAAPGAFVRAALGLAAVLGIAGGLWASTSGGRARAPLVLTGLMVVAATVASARGATRREAPGGDARPTGPNVLLVVLDTLRRDAVSAYGTVAGSTPNLDELASDGVLWEEAIANGCWTVPSHASLFTGVPVSRHGAGHLRTRLAERPSGEDGARLPTLAELFGERGWRTGAVVSNPSLASGRGFERGFGEYRSTYRAPAVTHDALGGIRRRLLGPRADKGGEVAAALAAHWISRRGRGAAPWFLFLNLNETHLPYDGSPSEHPRFREGALSPRVRRAMGEPSHLSSHDLDTDELAELRRAYLDAAYYQDDLLGRVLRALEDSGAAGETFVVVTSDHGENLGWEGLLGHGQALNDDLLAIPLVVRGPGLPRGRRDPTPVSLLDLFPSLIAWTGGAAPPPDPARIGIALDPGGPPPSGAESESGVSGRVRIAEKYPHFLHDVREFERLAAELGWPVERRWAWRRAALLQGGLAYRETYASSEAAPEVSLTRSGTPVDAPDLEAALSERLGDLVGSWPEAVGVPRREDDDALLARLRALGYFE